MPLREDNGLIDVREDPIANLLGWSPRPGNPSARRFREASEVCRVLWKILGLPGACRAYGDLTCPGSVCVVREDSVVEQAVVLLVVHLDHPSIDADPKGYTKWHSYPGAPWDHAPGGDRAFVLTCRAAEAVGGVLTDDCAVLYAQLVARWSFEFLVEAKGGSTT